MKTSSKAVLYPMAVGAACGLISGIGIQCSIDHSNLPEILCTSRGGVWRYDRFHELRANFVAPVYGCFDNPDTAKHAAAQERALQP